MQVYSVKLARKILFRVLLTKSNEAIFFLSPCAIAELDSLGTYLPTKRVLGTSSLGARSCQTIFSGGFWEVGVKNDDRAFSIKPLIQGKEVHIC